jgi:hypothetical protein
MKKILFLSFVLAFMSCSKDENEAVTGDSKPIAVEETNGDPLSDYSSFEVTLPENLRALTSSANATFAVWPSIFFSANDDNTIDVYWEGSNTALDGHRHFTKISLQSKQIVAENPLPAALNLGKTRFLGYDKISGGRYIMGTSDVNSDNTLRKNPKLYCFDSNGTVKYTIDLWKDCDPANIATGQAGQAIMTYNKAGDTFGVYMAHRASGHQAGWLSFYKAETGERTFLRDWYISHNFDQRLLPLPDGRYVALAHGDALPKRSLFVEGWDINKGRLGWLNYYDIPGKSGDNVTKSSTGEVINLPNGNLAIVYATQRDHTTDKIVRDVRVAIVSGIGTSAQKVIKENWLTNYANTAIDETAGWGIQIGRYSEDKLFLAWNVFKTQQSTKIEKTTFALLDNEGNLLKTKDTLVNTSKKEGIKMIQPAQTMRRTTDGKYLVFLSEGSDPNKLRINIMQVKK